MKSRGFTLIEVLCVLAILVTLVGLLVFPAACRFQPSGTPVGPPSTIQMVTVQHEGHWWILCREAFTHHPDCPCRGRKAESEVK